MLEDLNKIKPEDCMNKVYVHRIAYTPQHLEKCHNCEITSKEECKDYVPMRNFMGRRKDEFK